MGKNGNVIACTSSDLLHKFAFSSISSINSGSIFVPHPGNGKCLFFFSLFKF